MASTNQTTNYGLPLYQTGDQALWTDTNTPFEEIDTALKTASDNASGAASSVSTLQTTVTALAQTVSGHTTQLTTLESSVASAATAQGTSFTAHGLNTATDVQTAVQNAATAAINSYDNTDSGLTAANVQDAIDELNNDLTNKVEISSVQNIDIECTTSFDDEYIGISTALSGTKIIILGASLKSDGRYVAKTRFTGSELVVRGEVSGTYTLWYYIIN